MNIYRNSLMLGIFLTAVIIGISFFYTSETKIIYGQFFVNEDNTKSPNNNSTSTSVDAEADSDDAYIVLTSQKLKKASFGYRDLVGQVKNIGNDTADSVQITLNTFDKNGDLIGTAFTYASQDSLKPSQKSSFTIMSSTDNFKGLKYYEISLQWTNPDGSDGYVENAKIYKDKK